MTGVRQLDNRVQSSVTGEGVHCKFKTYNDQKEKRSDKEKTTQGWVSVALDATLSRWGITIPRGCRRVQPARGKRFCEAETSNANNDVKLVRYRRPLVTSLGRCPLILPWSQRRSAVLWVSGCELWRAVANGVRCGSRAVAKLQWL